MRSITSLGRNIGHHQNPVKGKTAGNPQKTDWLTSLTGINYRFGMKRIRKKMAKPDQLGNVLENALKATNMQIDLSLQRLWRQWDDLVGPAIAKNARPAAIKGKLLLVNVSSAPWMQQLQYLKNDLMEKLNAAFDTPIVKDIRFKIGPMDDGKMDNDHR